MESKTQSSEWAAQILIGAQQAVSEAIERHRRLGESIVIWRDGQIITLTGDEIPPQNLDVFNQKENRYETSGL